MRALREAVFLSLLTLSIVPAGCSKDDPAVVHRGNGNDAARKGDWATAATEYGLAAQANPKDPKIWQLQANAYMKLDQPDKAAEALAKPAEYTNDPAAKSEAYRLIASMYVDRTEYFKAEAAFKQALKFNPNDELALQWLGELASVRGGARKMTDPADPTWLKQAVTYYDQIIKVNPENLFAYANKRVALTKYFNYELDQKAQADKTLQLEHKDAAKIAAAKTQSTESAALMDGLQKQIDEMSVKIKELQAAQKAKKPPS
jgi:tetratricopeptide (TPR) repeat protein